MKEIIDALKAIIDNPEDLSNLPGVINQIEEYQTATNTRQSEDLDKITRLQNANRNLLAQIPIHTGEPEPPKEDKVTFEDAQAQLLSAMQNTGGI